MDIYRYLEKHTTGQGAALDWVEKQTNIRTNHSRMLSGVVQGRFLMMVSRMLRPRRILELGTFTGYSTICLAQGLAEDGHIDTLEINDELEDIILGGFQRAGIADRTTLFIGDCRKTLARLGAAAEGSGGGTLSGDALYDLVYIDANKREYCEYYDLVFDLVRPGGFILADNVLWDGKVFDEEVHSDRQTVSISKFNEMVAADARVENVILPLRDGLNMIRKK